MSVTDWNDEDRQLQSLELQHLLCLLGSEASEQIDYLERHGYAPSVDELLLEFDRHYPSGREADFHVLLTQEQLALLKRISDQRDILFEDQRYTWEITDLRTAPWNEIRRLARQALETFGLPWGGDIRERISATWPAGWERSW